MDLEEACRQTGKDPGVHANMTQEKVQEYYDNCDTLSASQSQTETEA